MNVRVQWEADNDIQLPSVVEIPNDINQDFIAKWLSDSFGYLVSSYCIICSS